MAATVSWEGLRELAGFRAEKGRAISFYLNLDPRVSPTAGDVATRVNSLLDEAGKRAIAARTDLTHDQRVSLKADLDRIRSYYEMEFSRDGANGLAVFSDGLDNFWRPLPLTAAVRDEVKVNEEFYLTPLVPLVGRGDGALVAFVGRERGEQLGDQTPVAAPPKRFGTHHTRCWSSNYTPKRMLPLGLSHPRRVASEGGCADAGEALLAWLAAPESAELDLVPVLDSGLGDRGRE